MFKHYLQTALRNLWRFKFTTAANVLCLAFGLSVFLMAYGVFAYFASADSGFKNANRIYVLTLSITGGLQQGTMPMSPWKMGDYIRAEIPEVESVVRTTPFGGTAVQVRAVNNELESFRPMVAEDGFLDLFDIPIVQGKRPSAEQPNGLLIGRETAQRLFGDENVVGKTVLLNEQVAAIITGVLGDLPTPSHLMFGATQNAKGKNAASLDGLMSWRLFDQLQLAKDPQYLNKRDQETFSNSGYTTYLMLHNTGGLSLSKLQAKLAEMTRVHMAGLTESINGEDLGFTFCAIPVTRVLSSLVGVAGMALGLPLEMLLLFCGVIVLLIALVNYINLATAQAIARGREVALHRLLGASRWQLIAQVMFESLWVCALGLMLALSTFFLVKRVLASKLPLSLDVAWLQGWPFVLFLLSVWLSVGLLSAAYPARVLSRFRPLQALRGVNQSAGSMLSRVLVGVQFMAAGFMVVLLLVMYQQHGQMKKSVLASFADPVVVLDNQTGGLGNIQTLRTELLRRPQIKSVAFASDGLWGSTFAFGVGDRNVYADAEKKTAAISIGTHGISPGYFQVMNIKRLAGREFSYDNPQDVPARIEVDKQSGGLSFSASESSTNKGVIVNAIVDQGFADKAGVKNANELLGRVFYGPGVDGIEQFKVIGVVANHVTEMMDAKPQNVFVVGQVARTALIQIDRADVAGGVAAIDEAVKRVMPESKPRRRFADEQFEQAFSIFTGLMYALSVVTVLAFAISIMGMIGMVLNVLTRRTYEVGIRKVLGASSLCVLRMFLLSFAKPIVIANVLAWPLAYLICRFYLNLFAYRISLGPWPFVLGLLLTVLIAWSSVAAQTLRAARLKPAEVLHYE